MLNLTEVLMACSLLSIYKSCPRILESKFLVIYGNQEAVSRSIIYELGVATSTFKYVRLSGDDSYFSGDNYEIYFTSSLQKNKPKQVSLCIKVIRVIL